MSQEENPPTTIAVATVVEPTTPVLSINSTEEQKNPEVSSEEPTTKDPVVNFDRVHQEDNLYEFTWEYEKLSVRIDEAFEKMDLLYDSKKYFCYPFLMLSWVFKVLYIFIKKVTAGFGFLHDENAYEDFPNVREKSDCEKYCGCFLMVVKCCDCFLMVVSGLVFVAFCILTCVMWTLSNLFLFLSCIWCFTTDLKFESDYFYKIGALRQRYLHYQLKIKTSSRDKDDAWKARQQKKLEKVENKINAMIEEKGRKDMKRYGHVSPQFLNDDVQGTDLQNIPNLLKHLLDLCQVKVDEIAEEEMKSDERVKTCKLKLLDEFPTKTAAEIQLLVTERYKEMRYEELQDMRTSLAVNLSRKFLSALQSGSVSKETLFGLIKDNKKYDHVEDILKNVKITNVTNIGEKLQKSKLFSPLKCTDEHFDKVLSADGIVDDIENNLEVDDVATESTSLKTDDESRSPEPANN